MTTARVGHSQHNEVHFGKLLNTVLIIYFFMNSFLKNFEILSSYDRCMNNICHSIENKLKLFGNVMGPEKPWVDKQ